MTTKQDDVALWVLGVLAVILAVVFVTSTASAVGSSARSASPTPATASVKAVQAEPVTTVTTARAPAVARPTTTTTLSEALAIGKWYETNGQHLLGIQADSERAANAAGSGNTTALGVACAAFARTIEKAQAAPPIPSESVNRPWQAALSAYALGNDLCVKGTTPTNPRLLGQAADYIREGGKLLGEANAALEKLI